MPRLRIFHTRLRAEEKLLAAAASREGIPATLEDVTDTVFGDRLPADEGDVVLARCISHGQNEALALMLESRGVRVVTGFTVSSLPCRSRPGRGTRGMRWRVSSGSAAGGRSRARRRRRCR